MVGGRYLRNGGTKKTHVGIHTAYRGIKGLACNSVKDKKIALLIVVNVGLHCWLSPSSLFVVVGCHLFPSLFIFVKVVGRRHRHQLLLFIVSKFLMSISNTNFHLIVVFYHPSSVVVCHRCWSSLLLLVVVSCHC